MVLDPNKKIEDADLLHLVGAVLSNSKSKPKRGFRYRLRRWKVTLRKQTQKHPFMSIGVVVGVILMAFLLGAVSTSLAQKAGSVVRTSSARSGAGAALAGGGVAGLGQVFEVNTERRDIAHELMEKVVNGDYLRRTDIATGRFLANFDDQWFLLVDVDRTKFELARRGPGWVQVLAPYHASETRWMHRTHLSEGLERWKTAVEAIVRMVEEDKIWKLEHIRVY